MNRQQYLTLILRVFPTLKFPARTPFEKIIGYVAMEIFMLGRYELNNTTTAMLENETRRRLKQLIDTGKTD